MLDNLFTRRDALRQAMGFCTSGLALNGGISNAAQAVPAAVNWPIYHGPLGNAGIPAFGPRLLEDFSKARLRWDSQERDLPVGKLRSNGNPYTRPSGGMAGLIVAQQTLFFAYFQPSGKAEATDWKRPGPRLDQRIAADDVVLALDVRTGQTRWKRVLEDKGVNHAPSKRAGWAVTPAYHDGRIFSLGTTGRLYALDAGSGKVLWEVSVGAFHERLEALKKQALAQGRMASWPTMRCSLTVAGGILVVPNYLGDRDIGLAGYDPASGKKLWEVPRAVFNMAPPSVWRHEGREYLLAGTFAGHLRLIDPVSGKVLWEIDRLGPQEENLAPSATHVVVNVRAGDKAPKLYGAYRLDLRKPGRAWAMPDRAEFHAATSGDGAAYRRVSVLGDRFAIHRIAAQDGGKRTLALWLVDGSSGKIVHTLTDRVGHWPQVFHALGERQLLCVNDAAHCNPGFSLLAIENDRFRHLGETWSPTTSTEGTSGYEVPMPYPVLDGFLYLRTSAGLLKCFDLRV